MSPLLVRVGRAKTPARKRRRFAFCRGYAGSCAGSRQLPTAGNRQLRRLFFRQLDARPLWAVLQDWKAPAVDDIGGDDTPLHVGA